jgi:hypothetical protein
MSATNDSRIEVGSSYPVIGSDPDRLAIQVLDDQGEPAWVPAECLDCEIPGLQGLVSVDSVFIPDDMWGATPRGEVDVFINLSDGTRWTATFATFEYVGTMRRHSADTMRTLYGKLFWAPDLVVVDEIGGDRIREVVRHLVSIGAYARAFAPIVDSSDDDLDE